MNSKMGAKISREMFQVTKQTKINILNLISYYYLKESAIDYNLPESCLVETYWKYTMVYNEYLTSSFSGFRMKMRKMSRIFLV